MGMSEYRVLKGAHPALAFLAVTRLEVEGLGVVLARGRRDCERAIVLVVDPDHRALQSHATTAGASHHLLLALQRSHIS